MEEGENKKLDLRMTFRMFEEEKRKVDKIIRYAEDFDGGRKYENVSHFCRCAVMQQIIKEFNKIRFMQGRPKVYLGERE